MAKNDLRPQRPEPNLAGHARAGEIRAVPTLADVETLCRETAKRYGLEVDFRQSNHEGEIVDWLPRGERKEGRRRRDQSGGLHHDVDRDPRRDPMRSQLPTVEVHITNIHQREEFRHHSYVSKGAKAVICGFGVEGYALAIAGLACLIGVKAKA